LNIGISASDVPPATADADVVDDDDDGDE